MFGCQANSFCSPSLSLQRDLQLDMQNRGKCATMSVDQSSFDCCALMFKTDRLETQFSEFELEFEILSH